MYRLVLWTLLIIMHLSPYKILASDLRSTENSDSSSPKERKLTRVLSPRALKVGLNPKKGSLIEEFYQKQRESQPSSSHCPPSLSNEQVSNILNARYNQSRGTTEAVQLSESLLVSAKIATDTSFYNLKAIITPQVTAELLYPLQSTYVGSTVSQLRKTEEVSGLLAKYVLKEGGQPLMYRLDNSEIIEATLTLSITLLQHE
ncbi:MAG: hypothetical protein IBJ00_01365 [Alphaproteobacteria bacterium]|nr:hypothetical protein [Alphaproteobacteria bacterium]